MFERRNAQGTPVYGKLFPDAVENKRSLFAEESEYLAKNAAVIHHLEKLFSVCHVERGQCCFHA